MARVLWAALGVMCLVTVASLVGNGVWGVELTVHFRPQLAAASGLLVVLALLVRRITLGVFAAALVAVHAFPVFPYMFPAARAMDCAFGKTLRVMTVNMHHKFADVAAVERAVRSERPDVLLLTEFLPKDGVTLQNLEDMLPHRIGPTGPGAFDLMLMSRAPIAEQRVLYPGPDARFLPVLEARLCPQGAPCVTIVGLHAARPVGPESHWQDVQFAMVARLAARAPEGRAVVMGDLNTTPWSPAFRDLLSLGRLQDAALGSTFHATWRSRSPLFGLPLDHVLVGRGMAIRKRRVLPKTGSDHMPVVAEIAICGGGTTPSGG